VADWETIIAVVVIALALAVDWVLWRHHRKAEARDLDRLAQEAARNRPKTGRQPTAR
jgi:hypothetical protein